MDFFSHEYQADLMSKANFDVFVKGCSYPFSPAPWSTRIDGAHLIIFGRWRSSVIVPIHPSTSIATSSSLWCEFNRFGH